MSFAGYLKADTQTNVTIGPVVAVADGFTPVTNLSLSTADEAELIKHNATTTTDISGLTMAAITNADGYYALTLTAAVLDTEGRITVAINDDSLCLPVRADFMVQNANVYDSLHAAATTDYLQVDAIQISGDATAADNCELMFDGTGYAGGTTKLGVDTVAISGDTTAANNAELAFDGTGYGFTNCTIPTVTTLTGHTPQTGDSFARIGATGSGLTSLAQASVLGTMATSAATGDPTTGKTAMGYVKQLVNVLVGTAGIATFPAEAAPGNAVSLAEVIRAIHADTTVIGSTGQGLTSLAPSSTALTNATWTDAKAGYLTAAVATATALATAQADLDTLTGSDGVTLATSQANYAPATAAALSTMQGNVTDILADTNELQGDWTNTGRLDTIIDSILADTNELQGDWTNTGRLDTILDTIAADTTTDIPTLIADLPTNAELATEISDALTVDTIADSYSTDGNQPTITQALLEVRQMMQEKSITDTTLTVKKPDGSTSAMTFTLNSATTPTSITRAT